MKGLITKDYHIVIQQKRFLILYAFVAVVLGFSMDPSFIAGYMPMVGMLLLLSTISYDHNDNGFSFLMTMPVKPGDYAVAKYIFSIVGTVVIWGFSIVLQLASLILQNKMGTLNLPELVLSDVMILPIFFIVLSFLIPIDIKYPPEKGRVIMAVVFGVSMVLVIAGKSLAEVAADAADFDIQRVFDKIESAGALFAVFAVSIIAISISMMTSIRIMQNKEF